MSLQILILRRINQLNKQGDYEKARKLEEMSIYLSNNPAKRGKQLNLNYFTIVQTTFNVQEVPL